MDNPVILVVDDNPDNINLLSSVLRNEYKVKAATSGHKALEIVARTPRPDMILLDVMMPKMDGYQVCERLKLDPTTAHIPVIFVTAKIAVEDETRGLELGAVDYITKPINPSLVRARVHTHLALSDQKRELTRQVIEKTEELNQSRLSVIQTLGRAAEYKDNETGMHVIRMSHYSRLIAQQLDVDEHWVDLLFNASPMHDIGKIGIVDAILRKPGRLEGKEWQEMKRHSEYGADILRQHTSELLVMAREIALTHHEKWDGSGYPAGLKGTDIPLSARIVAIADVFDALTSERPYKPSWPVQESVEFIVDNAGTHFDPQLVQLFQRCLPEILQIREQFAG
ncbi:putative two-component system response regulator [Ferrimonas sediminum]|uniref:Putative two-component system response regulator n=1 Tax=Ferrimonas sediminum TaxID=718193 RepID=A0A1G8WXB6_9GAMM|nr:two-component system response regulator [Ferrimonas sediminum]SDJ82707.1 putative two-component system response regulator [Ferrimonas sediminum]